MDFEQAKEFINSKALSELIKDKSGKGYICPICNSGSGAKGTGITTTDNIHFTCWAGGCFKNASWIDILAVKAGISPDNTKEAIENALNIYGIKLDSNLSFTGSTPAKQTDLNQNKTDLSKQFSEWHKNIKSEKAAKYLESRGITPATAERFNLGFCENWKSPAAIARGKNPPASERLIIPTSPESYLARAIDGKTEKQYQKMKEGKAHIFNLSALRTAQKPIIIVEGELDAISIIQSGGEAIALGSVAMADSFILEVEKSQPKQPLIIALDNDESGIKAIEKIKAKKSELAERAIKMYFPDVKTLFKGCKDANELLQKNEFELMAVVDECSNYEEYERQAAILQLQKDSVTNAKNLFDESIEQSKTASYIPTGFNNLDSLLEGGLYSGLYIVGAISSLGKTTLCLQIGDQIARAGNDVLIFSLEMSKIELMAKSISRLTSILDIEQSNSNTNAKTTRGILTGSRYQKYNARELDLIKQAKELYFSEYAKHLYIYEGMGNIGVEQVKNRVEAFKRITGKAPIVIIDYLQILAPAPENKFMTDKQNTDFNVMQLKRISRDFNTAVIGISSFNRENYTAPVNMASFKESGAIEYSSDVLIGLQYKAMNDLPKQEKEAKTKALEIYSEIAEKAKNKQPIEIQLKVLKNRNGNKGAVELEFFPMFNKFKEPVNKDEWHR